jgi:hypothetical protein
LKGYNMSRPPRELLEQFLVDNLPNVNVLATGDRQTTIAAKPGVSVCDFCGAMPCSQVFDADDIVVSAVEYGDGTVDEQASQGGWGACGPCAAYITIGDKEALYNRAIKKHLGKWDSQTPIHMRDKVHVFQRMSIRNTQNAFWHAKK